MMMGALFMKLVIVLAALSEITLAHGGRGPQRKRETSKDEKKFCPLEYREVQLDLTPEIELFHVLFERSLSISSVTSPKQHFEYVHFRCQIKFDLLVQKQPLPGAEEPVQVRRLLHEPPRAEGAAAVDRRVARRPRQTLSEELPGFDALHQQCQQEGLHGGQRRLRREERKE